MLDASKPVGRIIMRIIVLHMSAQFMHIVMHEDMSMPMPDMLSAQMVHAISQAEQASIADCIFAMSMPAIGDMPCDIDIIMSLVIVFMTECYDGY